MNYRKAFVVALLIITISKLGISEDVPDDVVYTEMKKTLVNGTKGVLTCLFKGDPNAVYWKKGSSPENAESVMTRGYGKKFGPRYEDGSCDIDENYSLIIKQVTHEDEGRYICRVSTYKGVLEYNFTDITVADIAVKTEPQVSVQRGKTGILPCKVLIRPRKVSWGKGLNSTLVALDVADGVISGPGHEEGLFNMTKDYSLVIREVTLQHGDNYFCEVTEFYTGRIYRDLTVLAVYVPPTTPFPTIEGCPVEDQTNCIITTGSSITLTCNVDEYYPDINLFFIHGSKRVESINTQTWNNTDGTKNKSVTISADKSRDAYKCIASGIPGLSLNDEIPASVRLIQEQRISLILTVLFVLIVICLTGVLLTWMKLRKRGKRLSKEEEDVYMEDHISFVELWQLAELIADLERDKIASLIKSPNGNEELPTDMNQDYYYQELCRWKDANVQTVKQRTALYEKFSKVGVDELLKQLERFRKDILAEVPTYDLEHILWQIGERQKIQEFLENLGVKIPTEKIPVERKLTEMKLTERKSFIQEAVDQLVSWTKGNLTYNPVVVLSSTLEKMGMCTADNNFFQLTNEEKKGLQDKDVERNMRDLTKNHCEKFERIIKASGAKLQIKSPKIAKENNKVLFDTQKMLRDWWEDVACSNYDKRRKLENVIQEGSKDTESTESGPWLSDEELKIISRYLDSVSMASLCEKLCISTLPEDADEKGRFETLCVWRESVTESEWVTTYGHLRNALGEVGILGLLAPLKGNPIHKAEYVDIALTLLMGDVIPAARALGINDNKLSVCRPVFHPTHLKKGTIGLVAQFVESTNREKARLELCSRLREAGFPLAIARNILVHRMAYGELHAISEEMKKCHCEQTKNDSKHDEEKSQGEGDSLLQKDNTSMEMETPVEKLQEEEAMAKRHLTEIKKILKLSDMTDEDQAECLNPKECDDEFAWFGIWKKGPHLAVFNERAAIIQGLFDMQRDDIARSVAEGSYYSTEISLPFLKYIVMKITKDEILQLAEMFKLKKELEGAKDSDDFAHVASKIIHGSIGKNKSGLIKLLKAKEDKALIDKLVENSFLEIAQELIIIQK